MSIRETTPRVESLDELIQAAYLVGSRWSERWSHTIFSHWYRGIDNASYSLDPSALRNRSNGREALNNENQNNLNFWIRGRPYIPTNITTSWEKMFLMQHYGFPTRLLDWSESLMVAAYFSVRDIKSKDDGAVWILSPQWLTLKEFDQPVTHINSSHPWLQPYTIESAATQNFDEFNQRIPLPIIPDHIDERILVQQGRFTIHSYQKNSLENLANEDKKEFGDSCFIRKIIIPTHAKPTIRQQLKIFCGISESSLFPGLEGLSRAIRWDDEENKQ